MSTRPYDLLGYCFFQSMEANPALPMPTFAGQARIASSEYDSRKPGDFQAYKPDHGMFFMTLKGHGFIEAEGRVHQLSPGAGFLQTPGSPEVAIWFDPDSAEKWEIQNLFFRGEIAVRTMTTLIQEQGRFWNLPVDSSMAKRIDRFTRVRGTLALDGATALEILAELASALLRNRQAQGQPLAERAYQYMQTHCCRLIQVEDVASHFDVSREHLSRSLKKRYGISPLQLLNHLRIEEAKALLLTTRKTAAEISHVCGFHHPVTFNQVFRRLSGTTPNQWRRQRHHF